MDEMLLRVVTPETCLLEKKISSLVCRGTDSELCVLKNHAPALFACAPGQLRIVSGGETLRYEAGAGVLRVRDNELTFFTETLKAD